MGTQHFLVELGCEELPPSTLKLLSESFAKSVLNQLKEAKLSYSGFEIYAAPRRLALLVQDLDEEQPDQVVERRGPAIKAAFDAEGNPTKAAQGFAFANNTTVDLLDKHETDKGTWLFFKSVHKGADCETLLPDIVLSALEQLPIAKRMRWGSSRNEFVRPVQWLLMMMGAKVVDCDIFGFKSGNVSWGHRFHANYAIEIDTADNYNDVLYKKGKVIPAFNQRRERIREQIQICAKNMEGVISADEDLLDQVTALTEWPVALAGRFNESFLQLPSEVLISSMKGHQKYFHLTDKNGQLMPSFITVANIESLDPIQVIQGNEKVLQPRLADAEFFFNMDKKRSLDARCSQLKKVVFQKQLGSLYDKTERIIALAVAIAEQEGGDVALVQRAAQLCKADLTSDMVNEFPELQGVMGRYYAQADGEDSVVCMALSDVYHPKFAGDTLPTHLVGCSVAIADRLDTITGIFGINQLPTGSKDPFALRRATVGLLRIIVEKKLNVDLKALIDLSIQSYLSQNVEFENDHLSQMVLDFILERFRAWYQDKGIAVEVFLAVKALSISKPFDFDERVQAVHAFSQLSEASSLSLANKRVMNLLAKSTKEKTLTKLDLSLLNTEGEKRLVEELLEKEIAIKPFLQQGDYQGAMMLLASLKYVVNGFFDTVLVNDEDTRIRLNRHALLTRLRQLFLQVADISLL